MFFNKRWSIRRFDNDHAMVVMGEDNGFYFGFAVNTNPQRGACLVKVEDTPDGRSQFVNLSWMLAMTSVKTQLDNKQNGLTLCKKDVKQLLQETKDNPNTLASFVEWDLGRMVRDDCDFQDEDYQYIVDIIEDNI